MLSFRSRKRSFFDRTSKLGNTELVPKFDFKLIYFFKVNCFQLYTVYYGNLPPTYIYLVSSSISTSMESCETCRSSRSIRLCTSDSFSSSICVCRLLTSIWSCAIFISVSICRETRRLSAVICTPTLRSETRMISVIGDTRRFCRSIYKESDSQCIM